MTHRDPPQAAYAALDHWVDAHFAEQTRMLQELVRVPTDTPPGNNCLLYTSPSPRD